MAKTKKRNRFLTAAGSALLTLGLVTTFNLSAQVWEDQSLNYTRILVKLEDIKAFPGDLADAIDSGSRKAIVCAQCHGLNGNSTYPWVPNLAGQNTIYLINQFFYFATGVRQDFVMTRLAETFSEDDIVELALFYNQLKVLNNSGADPEKITQGAQLYVTHCQRCHGVNALGKQKYPRLAGQQTEYLINSLMSFRSGMVNRFGSEMVSVLKSFEPLSDNDIAALASYLSAINP